MRRKVPHHADALSFMARRQPHGTGIDSWIVEGTGKFATDCERGRALADEFVAYLGEYTTNGNMILLGCIVTEMVAKGENQVPRGLIIGFMGRISEVLAIGARFQVALEGEAA